MVRIVVTDANTGRMVRSFSVRPPPGGRTVNVAAPGYGTSSVTVYPGDGTVTVSLTRRGRVL